jgi:hypothetical protein
MSKEKNNNEQSLFDFFKNREENAAISLEKSDDMDIKNAVFSTIDSAETFADIFELFTLKFFESHAEIMNTIPDSQFTVDENTLFEYFEKKRNQDY